MKKLRPKLARACGKILSHDPSSPALDGLVLRLRPLPPGSRSRKPSSSRTVIGSERKTSPSRFLNNIRLDDLPIRLTHDVAVALIGKRLTVGELVAHTVGFSNFEQVAGFMTKVLCTDFVRLVETTRETDHQGVPVLKDSGQVIADVKRALELRHIICHEGHRMHSIPNSEVKQLSYSCYMFVRGCQYAVARFLNPADPTTREDVYKATSMKENALRRNLKALEETIARDLHFKMKRESFCAMEEAWDTYVGREGAFFASVQMNGNQGELDAMRTRVRLTERRIEELQQWLDRIGRTKGKPV